MKQYRFIVDEPGDRSVGISPASTDVIVLIDEGPYAQGIKDQEPEFIQDLEKLLKSWSDGGRVWTYEEHQEMCRQEIEAEKQLDAADEAMASVERIERED